MHAHLPLAFRTTVGWKHSHAAPFPVSAAYLRGEVVRGGLMVAVHHWAPDIFLLVPVASRKPGVTNLVVIYR